MSSRIPAWPSKVLGVNGVQHAGAGDPGWREDRVEKVHPDAFVRVAPEEPHERHVHARVDAEGFVEAQGHAMT